MARSTYKTFLMTSTDGSEWTKLVDIKDYPDLGGAPEMLETTTLSDFMQTFVSGIQSLDSLAFTANYSLEGFKKIVALKGKEQFYAVWFGGTGEGSALTPDGSEGKFKFKGTADVYTNGGGVNEVTNMTITIAPSTPIELDGSE